MKLSSGAGPQLASSAAQLRRYVGQPEDNVREWRKSSEILLLNCAAPSGFEDPTETLGHKTEDGAHVSEERPFRYPTRRALQQPRPRSKFFLFFSLSLWRRGEFFFFFFAALNSSGRDVIRSREELLGLTDPPAAA